MDVSKLKLEPGSWQEKVVDVWVGIMVGGAHGFVVGAELAQQNVLQPLLRPLGFFKEVKPEPSDGLKVIGVGYGRTGTYSLRLALEELGYPTLHTQHLYEHDDIFNMWDREVFAPSFEANEAALRTPDFTALTRNGFQGTCDLPMALYFEQIHELYPDCKFILTERESSEVWFRSWDTLTKSITQPVRYTAGMLEKIRKYQQYLRWLFSVVNNDDNYLTAPLPLPNQNKESSIASYEEHNRRVREVIPEDKLLVYSVKQGWEPLCDFLEVENCPSTPFPKSNSARSVQVQSIAAFVVPLMVVLFIVFYLFTTVFQRVTGMTVLQWGNRKLNRLMQYFGAMCHHEKMVKQA